MKAVYVVIRVYAFGMGPYRMERVFESHSDAQDFADSELAALPPHDKPEFDDCGQVDGYSFQVVPMEFQEKTK